MRFENKTQEKIKVEKELNVKIKEWRTLKQGETIECKGKNYQNHYKKAGLTQIKSLETKTGPATVETKQLDQLKEVAKPSDAPTESPKEVAKPGDKAEFRPTGKRTTSSK